MPVKSMTMIIKVIQKYQTPMANFFTINQENNNYFHDDISYSIS